MNEFEDRLSSALRKAAEDAPGDAGLEDAARARHRRRRGVVTGGAVVAVAAVVLPLGVVLSEPLGGTGPGPLPPPSTETAVGPTDVPTGWRTEAWHDIELAVPGFWGYGSLSDWCAREEGLRPVVERTGGPVLAIACNPGTGYGVRLGPAGEGEVTDAELLPADAATGRVDVGDATVFVVTDDAALTEQVLATIHRVSTDSYGCATTEQVPPFGELGGLDGAVRTLEEGDRASLCRYETDADGPNLVQSERLSEYDTTRLAQALREAPATRAPVGRRPRCDETSEGEAVQVRTSAGTVAWVHYAGCGWHGVEDSGGTSALSEEVLYWTLSPGWSGSVEGSVPLRLRTMR